MPISTHSSLNESGANNECTILDILNQDCWYHIFSYLLFPDIIRSERVSKYWRYVVGVYMGRKRTLTVTPWIKFMSRAELQGLLWRHGTTLTRLELTDIIKPVANSTFVTSGDICPNLEELKIYRNDITHLYHLFQGCRKLQSITLSNCVSTDSFLSKFFNVSSIERLTLISNDTEGHFLATANVQSIKYLVFNKCTNIDTSSLIKIGNLSNLATLHINNCYFKHGAFSKLWQRLKILTQLQELSLCGFIVFLYGFTDVRSAEHQAHVQQFTYAFSKLTLLTHLYLKDNLFVTNEVLAQIAQSCSLLETLDVSYSYIFDEKFQLTSDEGIIEIGTLCENLKILNLTRRRELSAHGVVTATTRARKLERLIVRYLDELDTVSLEAILHVCPTLRELDMQCCNVTPAVMYVAKEELEMHPRPLLLRFSSDVYRKFKGWTVPKHSLLTVYIGDSVVTKKIS